VGSIGASLAWNAPSLVAGRVMQGIGGGLMLPVLTTLLVQAADGRSFGKVTARHRPGATPIAFTAVAALLAFWLPDREPS
jgi:MFS family permease